MDRVDETAACRHGIDEEVEDLEEMAQTKTA